MSIELEQVSFTYPSGAAPVLRRIGAEFAVGQVTLVTGALGSGCSTLLLTMAGLAPHTTGGLREGRVSVLGHDPATEEGHKALAGRVGVLLPMPWTQLSGMAFTVREEVAFGPANLGWPRARITDAVEAALHLLDVEHLAQRDPRTLSGGELQRVMFAAVVSVQPDVLLLDEPAQELDPLAAREVYALLPALAQRHTVVVATTDLDRAVSVSDRVLVMDRGYLASDGLPSDVLSTLPVVQSGASTTAATIAYRADCPAPFPVTVDDLAVRYRR